MIIFTNTKDISAKLLYDILMSDFNEFYRDEVKKDNQLAFGIAEENISVQLADGTELYNILVTKVEIVTTPVHEDHEKVGLVLEKFINASLM